MGAPASLPASSLAPIHQLGCSRLSCRAFKTWTKALKHILRFLISPAPLQVGTPLTPFISKISEISVTFSQSSPIQAATGMTDTVDATPDEALLVQAVQAGDPGAFEPLVASHLDAIHAFVALKLPVVQLIDEITHDTFVFAFRNIDAFAAGTSFRAWLRAIALNKIRAEIERYCRDQRNRLAYSEHHALQAAMESRSLQGAPGLDALDDCLRELPQSLRDLLTFKYHDESTSEQIAARMKRSVAWVRTTLCRVRQQLHDCIQKKLRASC